MENSRLKFRVWNGIEMEYNVMVGHLGAFYVRGLDENDSASVSPFNTRYADHVPVMQSTGLHDKNGKEIYEGDIMQHKFDERLFNWLISFDDGAFVLQNIGVDGYLMDKIRLTQTSCIERIVIGNIYENPELLNP